MSWKYRLAAALSVSAVLFVLFYLCYLAFLLIVFSVVPFGDGHTSVRGKVSDTDGKTITGARVTLTELESSGVPESHSTTTGEKGEYSVGITHYPTKKKRFKFEVSKEEFVQHKEELTGTANYEKDIVLQREKK
jgi:hypothetical protein